MRVPVLCMLLACVPVNAAAAQAPELRMPGETFGDELHVLAGVILDQYRKRSDFLAKILNEAFRNPDVGALF